MATKSQIEDQAAALAAYALDARAQRIDVPGAGDNLRDFDLVFADGHREPLEITADVHAPTEQSRARMGDGHFPAPELDRFWSLDPGAFVVDAAGVERPVDVREIVRKAPGHLSVLEGRGITGFNARLSYTEQPEVREAARALSALEIKHGYSHRAPASDHGLFIAAGSVGYAGADLIAEAVERHTSDAGNRRKVAGTAPRRHLLVIITPSRGVGIDFAPWALSDILQGAEDELPRLPALPREITTVWAASEAGAIFVTPPEGWNIIHTPSAFWNSYEELLIKA